MTGSLAPLLAANGLYLAIGTGLLPLLRIARSWSQLAARSGLAYMVGVAAVGILAAHLALVNVALGLPELSVLAAVSLALGARRLRRHAEPSRWARPPVRAGWIVGGGSLVAALVLVGYAAPTFYVRPLLEWDGWAIWAMKARALYEFGGAGNAVFTSGDYFPLHLDYPLLYPTLESIGFRVMGSFDPVLVHVQLIALAFGFVLALAALLAGRVPIELVGVGILVLAASDPLLGGLASNMADVPLAFFVGLGLAGLGRWLVADEGWALVCAVLFLGAATLTKNEGQMFAAVAFVALVPALLLAGRSRLPRAGLAALGVLAILLPWRIFVSVHGLRNTDYTLSSLFDWSFLSNRTDRLQPSANALWTQMGNGRWGYLVPLFVIALVAALVAGRPGLALFAALWAGLSYAALVVIYWISTLELKSHLLFSADRTVIAIVIGGTALAPLLVGEAWRLRLARAHAEPVAQDAGPVAAQALDAP